MARDCKGSIEILREKKRQELKEGTLSMKERQTRKRITKKNLRQREKEKNFREKMFKLQKKREEFE